MNSTIVTGIWDIKRDTLDEGWKRSFEHYLNHLKLLMLSPNNMIIYIEKEYENLAINLSKDKKKIESLYMDISTKNKIFQPINQFN